MFSRLASCHGEHGNVAPLRSSSSVVGMRLEASTAEYFGVDNSIGIVDVEVHVAIVVWHGDATCIGVICQAGEDVGSGKDKECGVPTCMGDDKSCGTPTRIGIVRTGSPLPKPGAWLAAEAVCSMALKTALGPVSTGGWAVAGDADVGESSRGGILERGDEANVW